METSPAFMNTSSALNSSQTPLKIDPPSDSQKIKKNNKIKSDRVPKLAKTNPSNTSTTNDLQVVNEEDFQPSEDRVQHKSSIPTISSKPQPQEAANTTVVMKPQK